MLTLWVLSTVAPGCHEAPALDDAAVSEAMDLRAPASEDAAADQAAGPDLVDAAPLHQVARFSALGDIPYAIEEEAVLARQLMALPADSTFVVHLGDIKTGAAPCVEPAYSRVAAILRGSPLPLFIVPGDNEWNDCTDPAEAWQFWTRHFLRIDEHWPRPFVVERPAARPEDLAFRWHGALFIGLNLVGGRVHDAAEWRRRHAENLAFVHEQIAADSQARAVVIFAQAELNATHQDFTQGLVKEAMAFARPMLYLHGDGHKFYCKRPYAATNLIDVQIDASGMADPLRVEVTLDPGEPFVFQRSAGVTVAASSCR